MMRQLWTFSTPGRIATVMLPSRSVVVTVTLIGTATSVVEPPRGTAASEIGPTVPKNVPALLASAPPPDVELVDQVNDALATPDGSLIGMLSVAEIG